MHGVASCQIGSQSNWFVYNNLPSDVGLKQSGHCNTRNQVDKLQPKLKELVTTALSDNRNTQFSNTNRHRNIEKDGSFNLPCIDHHKALNEE